MSPGLQRRLLFIAALSLALEPLAAAATEAEPEEDTPQGPPGITVSMSQMQAALAQRFPLRYPLPGVMNLDLQTPRLQLLPEQNRLGAEMEIQAAGAALQRSHQGVIEVDFALRYEAGDRTVRAHRLRLRRLQFPTLQPGVLALLNGYAQPLAERSLLEVVLYRLSTKDLALADVMGLQPGSITVTDAGLLIGLVNKPL